MMPLMTKNSLPIQLNPQQQAAVRAVDGPVLLLAVPGSGKTTVLIARLGYMILGKKIPADRILTLTYTVSATKDMEARYRMYFGDAPCPDFRTINSLCLRIIRYFGRMIGREPYRLVTDDRQIGGVLAEIYRETAQEYLTESELANLRARITCVKNGMMTGKEIEAMDHDAGYPFSTVYRRYVERQRAERWMDFDDQMTYAWNILRRSPETRLHFQEQYPYICVDEAQDTSKIQHAVIRLLAGKRDNLFMVGDEDQSIYGFRAAYPEALLDFEKQHPGAKVLLMEENYRSDGAIVDAADRFIQRNALRHPKHMRAARKTDTRSRAAEGQERSAVRAVTLTSRAAQYAYLAKVAADCRRETAVLYRDNESALPLVDLLERRGIPYRIRSADLTFFTSRVVTDIVNICRFALDPSDSALFLQIYYKLNSYLSRENAVRVAAAPAHGLPVLTAVQRDRKVPAGSKASCRTLQNQLYQLTKDSGGAAVRRIVSRMGYGDYLEKAGLSDGKIAILTAIADREGSMESFLARLDELRDVIREHEERPDCLFLLSTIHGSKGLEYDRVYLMDVADGIFPDRVPGRFAQKEERAVYEEERRLFYVAATRAKNELNLFRFASSALADDLVGTVKPAQTAQGGTAEVRSAGTHGSRADRNGRDRTGSRGGLSAGSFRREEPADASGMKPEGPAFETYCQSFSEGQLVEHSRFGTGTVTAVQDRTITVRFGEGEKKMELGVLYAKGLLWVL